MLPGHVRLWSAVALGLYNRAIVPRAPVSKSHRLFTHLSISVGTLGKSRHLFPVFGLSEALVAHWIVDASRRGIEQPGVPIRPYVRIAHDAVHEQQRLRVIFTHPAPSQFVAAFATILYTRNTGDRTRASLAAAASAFHNLASLVSNNQSARLHRA